jgi:prevent-host-death family protein
MAPERTIPAGQFKAERLKLMDEVDRMRLPVVITKRGRPVARLVPVDLARPKLRGCMKGTVTIHGDILVRRCRLGCRALMASPLRPSTAGSSTTAGPGMFSC